MKVTEVQPCAVQIPSWCLIQKEVRAQSVLITWMRMGSAKMQTEWVDSVKAVFFCKTENFKLLIGQLSLHICTAWTGGVFETLTVLTL